MSRGCAALVASVAVACNSPGPSTPSATPDASSEQCSLFGQLAFLFAGAFGEGIGGTQGTAVLVPSVDGYPELPWAVGTETDVVAVVRQEGPTLDLSLAWGEPTSAFSLVADDSAEVRCDHPVVDATVIADAPGQAVLELRDGNEVLDSFPIRARRAESLVVFAVEDVGGLLNDPDAGVSLGDLYSGVPDWASTVDDGAELQLAPKRSLTLLAAPADDEGAALYGPMPVRWSFPDDIADDVPDESARLVTLAPAAGRHAISVDVGSWSLSFTVVVAD